MYDLVTETAAERKAIGLERSAEFILNDDAMNSIMRTNQDFIEIQLPITGNRTVTLQLVEVDIYQGNSHVYALPSNEKINVDIGKHYRGIVKGDYESLVAMSFFDGQIDGFISEQEMPTVTVGKKKNSNYHIAYYDNQLPDSFKTDCSVEDDGVQYTKEQLTSKIDTRTANTRCNRLYMEVDYDIYTGKGSDLQQTTNFVTGFMNQVITIYANEDIQTTLSPLNIWTAESPYTGGSYTEALSVLRQFQRRTTSIDGDLGHLVSSRFSYGGHAGGFDGVCNYSVNNKLAYSTIYGYYSDYPVSSYTVMVVAHEFGHLFGSRHTHACVWNGNSTAIDSCAGYVEGYCAEPGLPTGGGTMMSYCYNLPSVGTNFSKGFGEQPGNVIRNVNSSKSCNIRSCDDNPGGGDDTTAPTKPLNLKASQIKSTSMLLTWTNSSDNIAVTGYEIYKNGTKMGMVDSSQADVTGLTPNTTYKFKVRAYDAVGNKSPFTNEITIKTKEDYSCSKTTANLVLKTDKYPKETSWVLRDSSGKTIAQGSPQEKLTTYEKAVCLDDGCYTFLITDSQGDGICCGFGNGSYSITINGKIVAQGGSFSSQDSKEFCIGDSDTVAPTVPTNLVEKATTINSISLAWSASTDNVGVEGYIVYQNGVEIGKTASTTYTAKGLKENTTYVYYVKAYDKANNTSAQSKSLSVTTPKKDDGGGDCKDMNVVFELTTDKYGNETTWEIKNASGKVVASGNRYGENKTYKINKCLPNDCYTFTIKDSYGDGICCKYGNGSYKLTVNGVVKSSGSNFGSSASAEFCAEDKPTDPVDPTNPTDPNPVQYCELKGNNVTYEWIESVKINDTENRSGTNGGYADFTNKVMNIKVGANTITATPGFRSTAYTENWYLWIDYNQDGTFSANELATSGRGQGKEATIAPFTVPSTAKLGNTRLRVAMKSTATNDACGSFTYGEVEDYTANIQASATTRTADEAIIANIYPNPAPSSSVVSINVNNINSGTYQVSDAVGNVLVTGNVKENNTLNTSSLSSGIYLITIESGNKVITKRLVIQ